VDATLSLRAEWPARRALALGACALLVGAALVAAALVSRIDGLRPGPNDYDIPAWELRNLPGKWLFAAGELFREDLTTSEEDALLLRFFALVREIDALEAEVSDARQRGLTTAPELQAALHQKQRQRDATENRVEHTLEGLLAAAIGGQGLTRSLGPLGDVVWPPVDFELTRSPHSLALSPRDRIQLLGTDLLREDLSLAAIEAIEQDVAARRNLSTLAVPTGGVGAYPTIVDYPAGYEAALEVIAHEWMHNYLAFRPLGINYYRSNDLRAMNETVASIAGRELARSIVRARPLDGDSAADQAPPEPSGAEPGRDRSFLRDQLRALRAEVDDLLAAGRIEEAEALMEARRRELAQSGYRLRKINQALFAFNNLYAGRGGSPAATNPIGPKLDRLRQQSGSLGAFVRVAGSLTSVQALDRALERLNP
jgi:hypothetical protein